MSNNDRKKGGSWFSNLSSDQNKTETKDLNPPVNDDTNLNSQINKDNKDSKKVSTFRNDSNLLSKDKQDKIVLDLIVSLENIIMDRELLIYKNKDIEEQLFSANETISQMKADLINSEQILLEKNKEILGLKDSLTNKQMVYDQLLEDYKEYQNSSTTSYEKISVQLDGEINKYSHLNEEFKNAQHENMLNITKLEEKVRNLQVENKHYEKQYKKVFEEKSELLKTINAFTEQMSSSLSLKLNTDSSDSE